MAQTCRKCSRVNPAEAAYCYHDGCALDSHSRNGGGPLSIGRQPFRNPFVFPSGRTCRTFDELALACQQNWNEAKELLQQGFLQSFLGGLGRVDLAVAAREAGSFPDHDRGLDQFLTRLPSDVLAPPQLRVEPHGINLGTVPIGTDRTFELTLENQGMRLLHGSITCEDCVWLALGDGPGTPEKHFQVGDETVIPVHVRGRHLRASNKPLEGRLVIESSGGSATVVVRVKVPIKPFAEGVLAGALTPRQIAEKAKAAPKEAAALFEKGAVARWYKQNGWTYPVRAPSSYGIAAVQQFFEALGLTPPPKVEVSEREVRLQGSAGEQLSHTLEVRSPEKRPVWAHAASDQPWLEVGRSRLSGNNAAIPLNVPRVPDRSGEVLTARVTITSNGNQRFTVPVSLTVGEGFNFAPAPPPPAAPVAQPAAPDFTGIPPRQSARAPAGGLGANLIHLVPAALLGLVLLGALIWNALAPVRETITPRSAGSWTVNDLLDADPRLGVQFYKDNQRFGILVLKERDPENPDKPKRLTYQETGNSNNTCIKIDNHEYLFGLPPGRWRKKEVKLKERDGWYSVVEFPNENVVVTQTVEIVPGEQTRVLDTCLVRYTIENNATVPHNVGIRVMLDTFIGANDGVPFAIPGQAGLLDSMKDFGQKDIPDYIQALEKPDLKDPGTVAHMGLKILKLGDVDLEPMEKLRICRWPGNSEERWDWDPKAMNEPTDEPKDSCVTLYWAYRKMNPKEKREMAFTYGLNTISSGGSGNANLSLTAGGSFKPGGEFTVTAYVRNPQPGQKVKLLLPSGLTLLKGQEEEQTLDQKGDYTQASWRVRAEKVGTYTLEVASGLYREKYQVPIKSKSFLD